MTLALGFIATSPGGQAQGDEVAHEFELVDVQPPDAYDNETSTGDSNETTSGEASAEDSESEEPKDSQDTEFTYENCAAARDDGAAPVLEGEPGFGSHLDADDDGIGCEQ